MSTREQTARPAPQRSPNAEDPHAIWPYAQRYLLETLDPALIEHHAVAILSRSLNIGRVTAFLGAGVSMSYGRIGWRSLVEMLYDDVERRFFELVAPKVVDASTKSEPLISLSTSAVVMAGLKRGSKIELDSHITPEYRHLVRLYDTLVELKVGRSDIKADRYPMIFQVCEQLDDAISRIRAMLRPDEEQEASAFRSRARRATKSDIGHATDLLRRALSGPNGRDLDSSTRTTIDAIEKTLEQRGCAGDLFVPANWCFLLWNVRALRTSVAAGFPIEAVGEAIAGLWKAVGHPSAMTHPTRRYLFATLLALTAQKSSRKGTSALEQIEAHIRRRSSAAVSGAQSRGLRPRAREASIDLYRDPLRLLHERLEVNRFLTTNFDMEINRYLLSRVTSGPEPIPGDPRYVGTSEIQQIVFNEKKTGDLIRFMSGSGAGRPGVAQLHGNVNGDIVVTEVDYQKRYLKPGPDRDFVDDAVKFAFAANPLLFVGSNMSEDDLLRPLRQFMSTPSAFGERTAIALIPAMASKAARTEEKIALLARHGVYAIHFGRARVVGQAGDEGGMEYHCDDWLESVSGIRSKLIEIFDCVATPASATEDKARAAESSPGSNPPAPSETPPTCYAPTIEHPDGTCPELSEFRSKLRKSLHEKGMPFLSRGAAQEEMRKVDQIEGVAVDRERQFDISLEIDVLNWAISRALSGQPDSLVQTAHAAKIAVEGAWDAILATFTCARLLAARADWDGWRARWFRIPAARASENSFGCWPATTIVSGQDAEGATTHPFSEVFDGWPPAESPNSGARLPLVTARHITNIPVIPSRTYAEGRFYVSAPSQSFWELSEALDGEVAGAFRNYAGRRILLLVGQRGAGRGHFFNTLFGNYEMPRLALLLKKLKPSESTRWCGVGFFNLAYSHEIMSVFDRIAHLLHRSLLVALDRSGSAHLKASDWPEAIRALLPFGKDFLNDLENGSTPFVDRWVSLRANRIERFITVMKAWQAFGRLHPERRVVIALNATSILFDASGRTKNGQIRKLFRIMTDAAYRDAPIDLVLVSLPEYVPAVFRRHPAGSPAGLENDHRLELLHLRSARDDAKSVVTALERVADLEVTPDLTAPAEAAVHILRPTRAAIFTFVFFPRLAILIARRVMKERGLLDSDLFKAKSDYPDIFDVDENAYSERLNINACLKHLEPWIEIQPRTVVPVMTVLAASILEIGCSQLSSSLKLFANVVKKKAGSFEADFGRLFGGGPAGAGATPRAEHFNRLRQQSFILCAYAWEIVEKYATGGEGTASLDSIDGRSIDEIGSINVTLDSEHIDQYERLFRTVEEYDDQMRRLHEFLGHGRMALTLLLAAAFEHTTDLSSPAISNRSTGSMPIRVLVERVMARVDRFITRMTLGLEAMPDARKPDVVIDGFMKVLDRHHRDGHRLPYTRGLEPLAFNPAYAGRPIEEGTGNPSASQSIPVPIRATTAQHRLCKEILWHLAMIGHPVELDVLQECHAIVAAARALDRSEPTRTTRPPTADDAETVKRRIAAALGLCVARCLVFRIHPAQEWPYDTENGAGDEGHVTPEPGGHQATPARTNDGTVTEGAPRPKRKPGPDRFTVHRLIQRHLLAEMGTSPLEVSEWDQFTLSLHASQPDEMPEVGSHAHRKIFTTIKALTGYPDETGQAEKIAALGFDLRNADSAPYEPAELALGRTRLWLRSRMLRAGYGIIRTIYSIGVLSHFRDDDHHVVGGEKPFEQYRRLVRWMIRQAGAIESEIEALQHRADVANLGLRDLDVAAYVPFYPEELVWLYNECGVLSHVEGMLPDAHALFEMALNAAEKYLEPSEASPLHVRIRLNQAMVMIERGHSETIRPYLEKIAAITDEHPVPPLIARGYLAVIAHLAGNFEAAGPAYESVVAALVTLRRSRTAAIFARHLGDLKRATGPGKDGKDWRYWLEQAAHMAQKGSHMDVYHLVVLSQVRSMISTGEDQATSHRRLDAVERYGLQLGLERILCEVSELRARLLLNQGETRLALAQALRSLEIANRNDLKIRKAMALAILSEIYIARSHPDQAAPLIALGISMAESAHASSALSRLKDQHRKIASFDVSRK